MLQKYDPKNRDILINVNGVLAHRDQARISPFDSSVQAGDAVWEGLRVYDGRIYGLSAHLARLFRSAKALGFESVPSEADVRREIARTLAANAMEDGVHVRLTLTRGEKITSGMDPRLNTLGPTLIVLAEHKAPVYGDRGIALITSAIRRFAPDALDPKIHHANLLQSILAKMQANAAGADDALMLDARGFVAETNATNVFVVRDGAVATPRAVACPEGVTRAAVLALCRAHDVPHAERDVSLSEVHAADEVFCTGTMGEVVPVVRVDGIAIGDGAPGPRTRRLAELYRAHARAAAEPILA